MNTTEDRTRQEEARLVLGELMKLRRAVALAAILTAGAFPAGQQGPIVDKLWELSQ